MAQVSESRPTSSAQPNIQDVFLNHARRDRTAVIIQLMDGRRLDAVIKSFDRFAVTSDELALASEPFPGGCAPSPHHRRASWRSRRRAARLAPLASQ